MHSAVQVRIDGEPECTEQCSVVAQCSAADNDMVAVWCLEGLMTHDVAGDTAAHACIHVQAGCWL